MATKNLSSLTSVMHRPSDQSLCSAGLRHRARSTQCRVALISPRRRRHKELGLLAFYTNSFHIATIPFVFAIILMFVPAVVLSNQVLSSSSSDIFPPSSFSYSRPTPFAPDYRPECDIVFPASTKSDSSSSFHSTSSTPASSHFGSSYFNSIDHQPHGEFLSNDLSSFYHKSSSQTVNSYLSSFAPRYVYHPLFYTKQWLPSCFVLGHSKTRSGINDSIFTESRIILN